VVVTRAPEQAGELTARLQDLGAETLLLPLVSFADPEDTSALDGAIGRLGEFDWVLLASQNAARFFAKFLRSVSGKVPENVGRPRYAAVGPATARTAAEEGLTIAFVASRHTGEALSRELAPQLKGKCVLLPRSDRARPDVPIALRAAGATVVDVIAYRTLAPDLGESGVLDRIRKGSVDVIAFASPSAFHHFVELLGVEEAPHVAEETVFAAIGPTTAQAIRAAGMNVPIQAVESTAAGLASAISSHFVRQSPAGAKNR